MTLYTDCMAMATAETYFDGQDGSFSNVPDMPSWIRTLKIRQVWKRGES